MRRGWRGRAEHALFGALVRVYPAAFRAEYGREMRSVFGAMQSAPDAAGAAGRVRLWWRLLVDTARSAPAEWWSVAQRRPAPAAPVADHAGAAVAALGVLLLYLLTLAPTTAFWDTGEYITVAHVAGIPHPPGNALFVFVARVWDALLAPLGWTTAVGINVFSAVCGATAHFFLFLCIDSALRRGGADVVVRRMGAAAAVLLSATAFTVWHQSNVNEKVYTFSFATVMAAAWLVLRWRDTRNVRLLLLAIYITALSSVNHLMGVLIAPALMLFVGLVERRTLLKRQLWLAAVPAVVLAFSAHLFLPLRAAHQPLVNESDPQCETVTAAITSIYSGGAAGCAALSATLRREQYAKPSILADPTDPSQPRGAGLIAAQFLNYAQYLDWQWARSVAGHDPLFGGVRPLITLLVLLLASLGAAAHWRSDRPAALLHGAALLTLSAGLVLYLNFRYGYTIAREALPAADMHEVRERDYFFLIGFSFWGAWVGLGIAWLWSELAGRLAAGREVAGPPTPAGRNGHPARPLAALRRARLAAAPVLALALLPLGLNWTWASRADDWTARDWAYNVLMSVEPYGVLVTNGDNDSFPLWYLQHVERVREDVTIVVSPYLPTTWYAQQIRQISRPCAPDEDPSEDRSRNICQRQFRAGEIHPRLLAAWGGGPDAPPKDSILPLSDTEIERMVSSYWVPQEPLLLSFGELQTTVPPGMPITPIDTFVAAILQSSWGKRPIHFMTPSPVAERLGLMPYTVRTGLTWKVGVPDARAGIVALGGGMLQSVGAAVDLPITDTLAEHVFIRRGRLLREDRPWVDHATHNIPLQYAIMHYAAALGHDETGSAAAAEWHVQQLNFWNRLIGS